MAKFARVGYGSQGQGLGKNPEGYVYVVNDNVRVKDRIQVVATSRAGRMFGTTAVPLSTFSENSVKGRQAKIDALSSGDKDLGKFLKRTITQADLDRMSKEAVTRAYSGTELGLSREGLTRKDYIQKVRGGNLAQYSGEKTERAEKAEKSYKGE